MKIVYIAAAILALVGMVVCSKKQKTNPVMQPVAFVLFVIVVIAGGLFVNEMGVFGRTAASLRANELKFYSSQGAKAGDFLKTAAPGKTVLLVAEPDFEKNESLKMLSDALRENYGGEVIVDTVELPGNPEEAPMPLYMMMKAKDFDALVEKHADAGVIVSTVGLPQDANNLKFIKQSDDKRPILFLIGLPAGPGSGVLPALQSGGVAGVIITSPTAKFNVSAPSDSLKAFDIRYVLVTKENAEQYKGSL